MTKIASSAIASAAPHSSQTKAVQVNAPSPRTVVQREEIAEVCSGISDRVFKSFQGPVVIIQTDSATWSLPKELLAGHSLYFPKLFHDCPNIVRFFLISAPSVTRFLFSWNAF
ncbi:hypothetical protein BCR34DRAFT_583673 [Clohesyomyces aquaticus]|uniref:Uncharacterized protein n=1 Tax=Clohesyomyces aquaticus TaxID=1231657 RepID=A0A1Y2A4U5_9PLEO|nr:hypothetical protein BCR34DRAFT_583673 [Clohesyomyces aquaticus]